MNHDRFLSAWLLSLTLWAVTAVAEPPRLASSNPPDGTVNVPVSQGAIVLNFSENMKMTSWSLLESGAHPFPPILPIEEPWIDPLTFEFELKTLQPHTTYEIQLNGTKRKGFLASADQSPLPVTRIRFTTGSADTQSSQAPLRPTELDSAVSPSPHSTPVFDPQEPQPVQIEPGWRFKVTRSLGMDGNQFDQSGAKMPFRMFQKIVFLEEVSQASGNEIQEAARQIESAELNNLDPETGRMTGDALVPPGTVFGVSHQPHGTTLINGETGEEIWDAEMVAIFAPPLVSKLWPDGALRVGQKWSYQGAELASRIALIDALGGRIDLQVEEIKPEPSTGLATAAIRGTLRTKIDLDVVLLDFDAEVEIDLPLAVGVPFMTKFEGKLSGEGQAEDGMGGIVSYRIDGNGAVLQIAKPSNKVIDAAKGRATPTDEPVDTTGAFRVPLAEKTGQPHRDRTGEDSSQRTSARGNGNGSGVATKSAPVYRYKLYEDTTERAFTVLLPQGWKAEGGIMQIPQHQIQTVVDGCGKKLYFSIYDPASQAYIIYFPTEIYHTSTFWNGTPGQVLNAMVQMPAVLAPADYVAQMVFPSSRPEAANVEWGERKYLGELANAWNRAFHSEDKVPPQVVAESIKVAYDRAGTRFAELWTALVTSYSGGDSTVWSPDFTVVAGAPLDRVEEVAPVLKAVITSFRMDPTWMATTIVNFQACTEQVGGGQERIRTMDRKIQQRLSQVQKEIRRIDNEIVGGQDSTRSTIQEHEHNTLMGNDEYEDSTTGNRYVLDLGYERNFTDGETVIQTNDWMFEPPPDYREMRNINISDY